MAQTDLQRRIDPRHESVRFNLLFSCWFACQPLSCGLYSPFDDSDLQPYRQAATPSPRTCRNDLLVLAFCGRSLGSSRHGCLYHQRELVTPMNTDSEQHQHETEEGVELPIPTAWPMVTAVGIMLLAAGFVISIVIGLVGVLTALVGAIGWFREVFPVPQHEVYPYVEPARRAAAIKLSSRRISHLALGAGGHRAYYPVQVHRYSSGILGGLAGGAAMAVLAMLYGLIFQHSIWYPINLLAAAGLPTMETANVATLYQFHLPAFIIAVLSHGVLSILVGMLYTVLLPMLPSRYEWFWGGIIIPLIWTAMLFRMFDIVNPALAAHVNWFWFIICQISFGLVGGYVVFKSQKVETMQTWSIAARMGVHAMEAEEDR